MTKSTGVRGAIAGVVVPLALFAGACGSGGSAQPAAGSTDPGTTITLYNAQHEQTTNALIAEFTKETGIKVRVDNNDEDVLTAQIQQEGSHTPADVVYTENSNWLQQLDDNNLLAKVDPATLASVPAADSATDGTWLGVSARISLLIYNTKNLTPEQLPKSILDLADPQWKGKLELAPAETDFWPLVSSVEKAKGKDATLTWLKAIKANAGSNANVPDNETVTSDIAKGTAQLGVINHYYFYRIKAESGGGGFDANVAYFAPKDPGYVEDISGAAVLAASKHQAAAQKFVAFLTSDAGQRILATSESFEYPIRPGVAANSELTPLDKLQPTDFTPADLGTGNDAKELLQQAGLL
jgi:iron(III) transport system substrate-binding protein